MKVNQAFRLFLWLSNFCFHGVNAIYIADMIRLYRLEDDFIEALGTGKTLNQFSGTTPTFTSDTPYGSTARQVITMYVDGNIRTDSTGLPSGSSPRTMMGWFKAFDGHGTNMVPFGYGRMNLKEAFTAYSSGQYMGFDWTGGGDDTWDNPLSTVTFTNNVWYHYTLTYDGTTLRAYLNGDLKRSSTISLETSTYLFSVGADSNDSVSQVFSPWIGSIADVAIFSRALTVAEIQSIYNAPEGLTPPCAQNSDCTFVSGFNFCGADGACTDGSNGSSCLDAQSCISTFCVGTSDAVCADGQIGAVCVANADCDTGLECDSSTCKASLGTACSGGSDCISGSTCLGTGQVCTDGSNGSACDSTTDCTSSLTCLSTSLVCTDGANNSGCDLWSDCSSGICAAGACGTTCILGSDCQSGYCVAGTCTTGELNANCGTGSDCASRICFGGACSSGANGNACGSGNDCTSGYCSPTSSTCATPPILDPCHGITCSNHGKYGSFLDTAANCCHAPTKAPTSSPTSLPVTSLPTLSVTAAPTGSPTFDTPVCEDDTSYKFELKRVPKGSCM
ncbi:hypothetical protein CTEN210_12248 [Chaetoceros tenuissimus]|uniref:LamG-like jellyroll fold domain-containing protein n=1 Tax=Chaetoceros tenuissimus TaxID=426638 RepID=A0AAD3H9N5_9STRA|nr:hypothetical protein CTEN210_12248 [Chaetoceros tenuissimus]